MKKIFNFIITILPICLFSQTETVDRINLKSPQSYSFEKSGNIPVNLYTGAIDLKIPITSIDLGGDKSIDVALSYDSSGFLPHKKSDLAGLNWSLMAGGRITRTINGTPDEYIGDPQSRDTGPYSDPMDLHGFLTGVRTTPYSNHQVYDLNSGAGTTISTGGWQFWSLGNASTAYEGRPDIYNFNIMNLHGKFMIGNDGNVLVESNDPNLKVDISEIRGFTNINICEPPLPAKITLTDGEGNKYIFGGDLSKYEITFYSDANTQWYQDAKMSQSKKAMLGINRMYPAVGSYSISKIILANNEEIDFEYMDNSDLDGNFCRFAYGSTNLMENSMLLSLESYFQNGTRKTEWSNCPNEIFVCASGTGSSSNSTETYALLKKSLLTSIKAKGYEIRFEYQSTDYPIKHTKNSEVYFNETLLNNISTYYNGSLKKSSAFSYEHFGGGNVDATTPGATTLGADNFGPTNKRPFLTKITDRDPAIFYTFEYYKTAILPKYYTKGLDHWGHWNSRDTNTSLAPFDTYNKATGDYTLNNTFRDANSDNYDVALLKKIVYPTKGYTIFEYEPHNYGKRIERISTSSFLPTLTNNTGVAGGARIKKQYDYSNDQSIENIKEYKYTTDLNNNTSSGILMNWPRYFYYIEFKKDDYNMKLLLNSSSNFQQNSFDSYNVGYSKVFEIQTNNGYVEHNFTNYENYPDDCTAFNIKQYMTGPYPAYPENLYKNFRNLYGIDKSILRGRLSIQKVFSKNGSLLKKTEYEYNDNLNFNPNSQLDNNKFVTLHHTTGFWVQSYKKYFNNFSIKKKIESDFLNNNEVKTYVEYFYDRLNHLQLSKERKTISSNDIIDINYFYPHDPEMSNKPLVSNLETANIKTAPLVTQTFRNTTKLSEQETVYGNDASTNNLLLPKKILAEKFSNANSNLENKITYDQYDAYGNIVQYTPEGGFPTAIIWGYNRNLPLAKIEKATYNQVKTYVSNLQTLSQSGSESDLIRDLNSLRTTIPDAMITTYTHIPLVGISTITDPKGQVTKYIYDRWNRLSRIIDHEGNILKEYSYNYKNQQSNTNPVYSSNAKTGLFTRNNCSAGFTGSTVTYTVISGAYTSTISQADADNKAITDLNNNGQNYANTNGICEIVYKNIQKSQAFTKNNCDSGITGSSVNYIVASGKYSSRISQADADAKAQNDIDVNGQNYANANGVCTYYNVLISKSYTKNNCPLGSLASSLTYTVAAGICTSTISQIDADNKAIQRCDVLGQRKADFTGFCTFKNTSKSGVFTKNNCPTGAGMPITYNVSAGVYTSTISQEDADAKAQNDVNTNGQNYANTNGTCGFYNVQVTGSFTRNNCGGGYIGSTVTYIVPAGIYVASTQKAANILALSDLSNNGQAYANMNGTCILDNH